MKKNNIIVTGGAGFVGRNLIKKLLLKTNYNIISLDDYSSGSKNNHIKNKRVKYFSGNTKEISKIFLRYKKKFIQFFILVNFLEYIKVFYK